ncbi:MAG TPA: glycosyltransferase family 9 protein [Chthoniobacterales bacterium]
MSRILVIRGGAIGDFILTLPAIKLLRDSFPTAHLEILGYQHIVALARMSGYADATRSIEYGALSSFFSRGGELAPDLIAYFGSFQQVVSYLFDPDEIFAANLKRAGVRNFLSGSSKMNDQEHAARQLARPLERLALYLEDPAAIILPNEKRQSDPALIAIHPGSGSAAKNWPLERFAEVAGALLSEDENRRLLIAGGEADEHTIAKLAAALPAKRVNVARNRPLPELACTLQNCALFIGHDSGISHLAAAVGAPSLLLFGPTDPAIWAPANPQVRVLRSPNLAMSGIEVPRVLESAYELMRIGIKT